jgi:hypothetical protein
MLHKTALTAALVLAVAASAPAQVFGTLDVRF